MPTDEDDISTHDIFGGCNSYVPKADIIIPADDVLPTSHLSLSVLQIDWPAPQDKKRECFAKGKNNQVTWISADSVRVVGVTCHAQGRHGMAVAFQTVVYESNITHFTLSNYILSSQSGVSDWKPSSYYISTR